VTCHFANEISLESVPIVDSSIAITSQYQRLGGWDSGMTSWVIEFLLFIFCNWFVHFQIEQMYNRSLHTSSQYLMSVGEKSKWSYGVINYTSYLRNWWVALGNRVDSDTTISVTWVHDWLDIIGFKYFQTFLASHRHNVGSFFNIPDFELLVIRSTCTFLFVVCPSHRVYFITMA